jgi:hypothetical protein
LAEMSQSSSASAVRPDVTTTTSRPATPNRVGSGDPPLALGVAVVDPCRFSSAGKTS